MTNLINQISRFWTELKRREVLRRNSVYAGAAFIILQVVSIVAEPLNLPHWTMPLLIILLGIGLIISIIVSWLYEMGPDGNLIRTRPISENAEVGEESASSGWKIASYISFAVIVALIVINLLPRNKQPQEAIILDKSIAVLPFQNLSNDSSQIYFCEAMREEILNHIEKINLFSVRSRTSTDQYRNTTKNSVTIGQELKVNYLVEGSVSLIGNEMKIWLQLINARTDEHIWTDDFIREKRQIFELQTEIAKTLAAELKTTLTPEEIENIELEPTKNTEAYHAYMKGRFYTNQPHDDFNHWNQALKSFKEAVDLDTTFGLAYAELAKTYAVFYNLRYDFSDSCLEKARDAAKKALEYGNDLPEVHLQIGYYYFLALRDKKNRDLHWAIAAKGMPDNVDMIRAKYESMTTEGRWKEAQRMLEAGVEKNPNVSDLYSNLGLVDWFLRDYKRSDEAFDMALSLNPQGEFPWVGKAFNMWAWKGVNHESQEFCSNAKNQHWYHYLEFWNVAGSGRYQEALQLVNDTINGWVAYNPVYVIPHSLFRAYLEKHLGDINSAEENFRLTQQIMEQKVMEAPDDSRYHSTLGIAYAAQGKEQEALTEMRKAKQLRPIESNGMYGTAALFDAILMYVFLDDTDAAMDELEQLIAIPSPYSLKYLDWYLPLQPLKEHPRYAEFKEKYDPSR